jgi:hypothetical protein
MKLITLAIVAMAAAGCSALGGGNYYPLRDMTADQIKAAVSPKESSVTCLYANYGPATATTVFVNSDKGVPANMTIKPNCETVFDSRPAVPPTSTVVPMTITPQLSIGQPELRQVPPTKP